MIYNIHFSATDTTAIYANTVAAALGGKVKSANWLASSSRLPLTLQSDDILLFSMPVYGGFIPAIARDCVKLLEGDNTPAIILAVYGNRHYDNALVQMQALLLERGFHTVAAGAFVARHSIFPSVAADRPSPSDIEEAEAFARAAAASIERGGELELPGDRAADSSVFKGTTFHPEANDKCASCGRCAAVCPTGAVLPGFRKTDGEKCISCGACIKNCPTGARGYWTEAYAQSSKGFEEKNGTPRGNEVFFL